MSKIILAWKKDPRGAIKPFPINSTSFDEASRKLPEGVYTTFRTYEAGRVLCVNDHLERLHESVKLLGTRIRLSERSIRNIMRVAIYDKTFSLKRIRLQINLSQTPIGQLFVLAEELHTPDAQDYLHGVSVSIRSMHRENALAKSTLFIHTATQVRGEVPGNNNEVLMVGERGEILEGLSSNFFGFMQGKVWTAEEGILHGITRKMVLETCERCGLEVVRQPIHQEMLPALSEAFITSASRGILPIAKINEQVVGSGFPGEVTKTLVSAYENLVQEKLEEV